MKNSLPFLLLLLIFAQACTNNANKDGFIVFKPGQYCKTGSVTVVDGSIYIGGSFIKVDNPNTTTPLRQSYIASVDTTGNINWEIFDEAPDYIHWDKLVSDGQANLYAVGTLSSPFSSQLVTYAHLSTFNPKLDEITTVNDSLPQIISEAHITPNGQLNITVLSVNPSNGFSCLINEHLEQTCSEGTLNCIKRIETNKYLSAWGTQSQTESLYVINDTGATDTISIPVTLDGTLVNGILASGPNGYLLATTVKNGQGPCIYHLGADRNFTKQLCLNYWPMNGSVQMESFGNCTILAFNATDATKGSIVQLVIINSSNEVVFEETIAASRFVLSEMDINQSKIYLAGTLETDGEGSSMAIKTIPVPANANCMSIN